MWSCGHIRRRGSERVLPQWPLQTLLIKESGDHWMSPHAVQRKDVPRSGSHQQGKGCWQLHGQLRERHRLEVSAKPLRHMLPDSGESRARRLKHSVREQHVDLACKQLEDITLGNSAGKAAALGGHIRGKCLALGQSLCAENSNQCVASLGWGGGGLSMDSQRGKTDGKKDGSKDQTGSIAEHSPGFPPRMDKLEP